MKYPATVTLLPFSQHSPIQSRIVNDLLLNESLQWQQETSTNQKYKVLNQGAMDLLTTHKLIG